MDFSNNQLDENTPKQAANNSSLVWGLLIAAAFIAALFIGFFSRPLLVGSPTPRVVELVITATLPAAAASRAEATALAQNAAPSPSAATPTIMDLVLAEAQHFSGDPAAPVTMVEFSDFKCTFCGRFWAETLPSIREQYIDTGKIRFVYKHFAILGSESERAGEASECAAEQEQFWAYHNQIFADQTSAHSTLDDPKLIELAAAVGLKSAPFAECLTSGRYSSRVRQQTQAAKSLGMQGTPSFLINGVFISGAQPFEVFQQAIEEKLKPQASPAEASDEHDEAATDHNPDSAIAALPHLHGLGFSADGQQLFVPAHDGFRVFAAGRWQQPDEPAHDYMGYAPTDDGFYSSGHPNPTTALVNPFGLIKSSDGGQTLTKLGFEGESDFHVMGVGYQNHAIYVFNPSPNAKLGPGLHYSLDDGQTWQASQGAGLTAAPLQIAVHPTEAGTMAVATEEGLFLSTDYGVTFRQIGEPGPVTAAVFNPTGELLFFGFQKLAAYEQANDQILTFVTPEIAAEDALAYIAVNPTRVDEMALATFGKDIYLSQDGTQSWQQIAVVGQLKSSTE